MTNIKVNEYFNGKVKSLAVTTSEGQATVGVIAPGEYEFGTSTQEVMTVTSGELSVLLPGSSTWVAYSAGKSFTVQGHQKFKVKATSDVSYLCLYS